LKKNKNKNFLRTGKEEGDKKNKKKQAREKRPKVKRFRTNIQHRA
jgi:hypothetical protein